VLVKVWHPLLVSSLLLPARDAIWHDNAWSCLLLSVSKADRDV